MTGTRITSLHSENHIRKKTILVLIIILIGALIYLFAHVGTERSSLNDKQIESLCVAFAEEPGTDEGGDSEVTNQAAVEIFGVDANGEYKTVYGYVSEGEYLKHKDKAYEVSGGNWPFMVDVEIQGDVVKVVKEYGDGVSSESTYEEMPPRYRFKASNYDSGRCYKLQKTADKKAEEALGVAVERKYTLSIEGEHFKIYDMDTEGNVEIMEEGNVADL